MTLEVKEFVAWLEGGGFSLTKYKKAAEGIGFYHCQVCVMGTYLTTLDPNSDGCGNFTAYTKPPGTSDRVPKDLPKWATNVIQRFDLQHAPLHKDKISDEDFIADLKKVAERPCS